MPDLDELLRHDTWLRPLVRRLVGETHVDDVLQRTWMAAIEKPPKRPGAIRAWLRRVAGNFASDQRRADKIRRAQEAAVAVSPDSMLPSTEETVRRLAAQRAVTSAVMDLAEPYRTAVLLHHFHELPVRSVAERTGVTEANARQRIKRGLDEVRRRLTKELGADWRLSPAVLALALPHNVPPVLASGPARARRRVARRYRARSGTWLWERSS